MMVVVVAGACIELIGKYKDRQAGPDKLSGG